MNNEDVYFKCPCGKNLAVDVKGAGLAFACPECGRELEVPSPDIKLRCDCGTTILVPESMAGENVQCLACKTFWQVPAREEAPARAPAATEAEDAPETSSSGQRLFPKILALLAVIAVISVVYGLFLRAPPPASVSFPAASPEKIIGEATANRAAESNTITVVSAPAIGPATRAPAPAPVRPAAPDIKPEFPGQPGEPEISSMGSNPAAPEELKESSAATADVFSGSAEPAPAEAAGPGEDRQAGQATPFTERDRVLPAKDTPTAPPASAPPTTTNKLGLAPNWKSSAHVKSTVQSDLMAMMSQFGEAKEDTVLHDDIVIFQDLTYLMDVKEALKKLCPATLAVIPKPVNTPGLPNGSFQYFTVSKNIADQQEMFDSVILVADRKSQLVAVQLLNQTPKSSFWPRGDWDRTFSRKLGKDVRIYNIIQNRCKASGDSDVRYHAYFANTPAGRDFMDDDSGRIAYQSDLLCIDTEVCAQKVPKEQVRIYLPIPIVNLILYYLQSSSK